MFVLYLLRGCLTPNIADGDIGHHILLMCDGVDIGLIGKALVDDFGVVCHVIFSLDEVGDSIGKCLVSEILVPPCFASTAHGAIGVHI